MCITRTTIKQNRNVYFKNNRFLCLIYYVLYVYICFLYLIDANNTYIWLLSDYRNLYI